MKEKITKDILILLTDRGHYTYWNRFKTAIWNFILPPHIRLRIECNHIETLN